MTYCYFELDLEGGGVYVFWNIAVSQIFILIIGAFPVPSLFDNCREDTHVCISRLYTHTCPLDLSLNVLWIITVCKGVIYYWIPLSPLILSVP